MTETKATYEVPSRKAAWLADGSDPKRPLIGGSRAHRCLTDRYRLWAEMSGLIQPDNLDDNIHVTRGTVLEPVVLRLLGLKTGRHVEAATPWTRVFHPDHPWLCCTPDGWEHEFEPSGEYGDSQRGIVQAKTSLSFLKPEWEDESSDLRQRYWTQIQHEMLATGCSWGTLCVLFVDLNTLTRIVNVALEIATVSRFGERDFEALADAIADTADFRWYDFEADTDFHEHLRVAEQQIVDAVLTGVAPDPDGTEECGRCLRRIHPNDNGETVMLPEGLQVAASSLIATKAERAALEKHITDCENRIKAAIGDATYGLLPNGERWSWRTQRSSHAKVSEIQAAARHLVDDDLTPEQIPVAIAALGEALGQERKPLPERTSRILRKEKR
jgi:predicted phage-related endonuclease